MGKSGPKSKHPSGVGYTTSKGYHQLTIWDSGTRSARAVMAHVLIWTEANGPIPAGLQVHHKNLDKQDNRLDNLELVDALTHKRLHSGCELRDGVWWKRCTVCGEFKPIDAANWYFTRQGYPAFGRCRPCHIARVKADDKRRSHKALRLHTEGEPG